MNEKLANVIVAELCGYQWWLSGQNWFFLCEKPANKLFRPCGRPLDLNGIHTKIDSPSYTSDLNAMHEAEKMLTAQGADLYADHLKVIMARDGNTNTPGWCWPWHATAIQRVEAYIKTFNYPAS